MTKRTTESRYFEIKPILKKYPKARYYYILGGRGTGKTYPVVQQAITDAIQGKGKFAYVRRLKESLTTFNMKTTFNVHHELVEKLTKGAWNRITYWQRQFWLEKWEKNDETGVMERTAKNPEPRAIFLVSITFVRIFL